MLTFGTLDEVETHGTFCRTAAWGKVQFIYPESMSWYTKAKHWVDDQNQRQHIDYWSCQDLEETVVASSAALLLSDFLTITEVIAANSRGCGRGEVAEPMHTFWKRLAIAMLDNTLENNGNIVDTSSHLLQSQLPFVDEHTLQTANLSKFFWKMGGSKWATT